MGRIVKLLVALGSMEFGSKWGLLNCCGVALIFGAAYVFLRRSDHMLELRLKHLKSMSKRAQAQALSEKAAQVPKIVVGFLFAGFLALCICAVLLFPQ